MFMCKRPARHVITMKVSVIYYLEITSSWCYWAEAAWAELKRSYAHRPVEFNWEIALLDEASLPVSSAQADWFYRRSGTMARSPFMLNSGWLEPGRPEYLAPNCVASAAKDFGVNGDEVRLALAEAALRAGAKVAQWNVAARIAAQAAGLDAEALMAKA
jgi:predicted DsbA family dithiol-disulfide isomerase